MRTQTNLHAGEGVQLDTQQLAQLLQANGVQVNPQQIQQMLTLLGSQIDMNQLALLLSLYGVNPEQVNQFISGVQQGSVPNMF